MLARRRYTLLFVIVFLTALPGGGAYLFYHFTKNPLLQPLGLTRERLAEIDGEAQYISIIVHLEWGRDYDGEMSHTELREIIRTAFYNRTDEVVFKFREVPGDEIGVTFVVGPNRYGPYAPHEMIEGIVPATVALEMLKDARERAEARRR